MPEDSIALIKSNKTMIKGEHTYMYIADVKGKRGWVGVKKGENGYNADVIGHDIRKKPAQLQTLEHKPDVKKLTEDYALLVDEASKDKAVKEINQDLRKKLEKDKK